MDECVARLVGTFAETKRAMIHHQSIAKFQKLAAGIFCGVRTITPVMQVDFNFSPAGMTMIGNAVDQTSVVLLGGIKVSVDQRQPFLVAPPIHSSRIFGAP